VDKKISNRLPKLKKLSAERQAEWSDNPSPKARRTILQNDTRAQAPPLSNYTYNRFFLRDGALSGVFLVQTQKFAGKLEPGNQPTEERIDDAYRNCAAHFEKSTNCE
tara:strand:+ start:145 stop:465 length:321 start_codon:yes stop_codon:yes gene_type:complete